jgi:phage terminase small subunit
MINSAEGIKRALQAAQAGLQPTSELNEVELSHFQRVTASRETETWAHSDLTEATQLAILYRREAEVNKELDEMGCTVVDPKTGREIENPRVKIAAGIRSAILASRRALGLAASQRSLTNNEQRSRNAADAKARSVLEMASANSLLA